MNARLFGAGWILIAVLTAQGMAAASDVTPASPRIPEATIDLAAFGGVPDGQTDNTGAFAAAIAAIGRAGGGTLRVGPGRYLTGPLSLCSRLDLHLAAGAILLFSPRADDYPIEGTHRQAQVRARGCHDVRISGAGTLDGRGAVWWPAARAMRDPVTGRQFDGTTPRPPLLQFSDCQRVQVDGVTLQNSPALNLGINDCADVTIAGVTILNPADSPNTDGIDPKGAQRVLITRCQIDTGDDCIAAGGSRGSPERDILITDCVFRHGHGCSIGSGTAGGVTNLTVRRCAFVGTETGIRLKSSRGRGGLVEHLVYEDLTMVGVGRAISLNSHYEGTTVDLSGIGVLAAAPVTPLTPQWRHIVIRNLTATGGTRDAGLILGLPEMPAVDLVLEHIRIAAPAGLAIAYTSGITLRDVRISVTNGVPVSVAATVTGLTQEHSAAQ